MKCLILCGGRGLIDPETRQRIPKALIQVGGNPLVWHVMKTFAAVGVKEFILALGEGGEAIRRHFFYQHLEGRDVEIDTGSTGIEYLTRSGEDDWRIIMVDTGLNANTGSRIARCRRHVGNENFFVTYSDCLCNVDLAGLASTHDASGKLLTVTGVQPSSRFGTFSMTDGEVAGYTIDTKLTGIGGYLNGGYMAMSPGIFEHLDVFNECNLEREVFAQLAAKRQVSVFPHAGYWQAVDTERDLQIVTKLYLENKRPWLSLGGS
jgi:glucose-1-phosphate cytidylyltransferase